MALKLTYVVQWSEKIRRCKCCLVLSKLAASSEPCQTVYLSELCDPWESPKEFSVEITRISNGQEKGPLSNDHLSSKVHTRTATTNTILVKTQHRFSYSKRHFLQLRV